MGSTAVNRAVSVYLAAVGAAVAVQFLAFPFYAYDSAGERMDGPVAVWTVLDWFMAFGLAALVITTCREKKRLAAGSSTDVRRWLGANFMFYGAVVLTLAFMPNWFESALGTGNDNWTIWHLIDAVLPVLFLVEAHRLWRGAAE